MSKPAPLILIIEDDPDTSALYEALLLSEGMRVRRCSNGAQARNCWADSGLKPDLVVLDVRLPDASGLDLCREFVRQAGKDSPPVLVLSAHGDPQMPRLCREAGGTAFLDKLTHLDSFVATVHGLLARGNGPAVTTSGNSSRKTPNLNICGSFF